MNNILTLNIIISVFCILFILQLGYSYYKIVILKSYKYSLSKNIYDSGIVDIFFNCIAYSICIAALTLFALKGNNIHTFSPIIFMGSFFAVIKTTHGTREPYEYLKKVYVYQQENEILSIISHTLLCWFRLYITSFPLQALIFSISAGRSII